MCLLKVMRLDKLQIMHDPTYWKDAELFNPERFLNKKGEFVNDQRVIPFLVSSLLHVPKNVKSIINENSLILPIVMSVKYL